MVWTSDIHTSSTADGDVPSPNDTIMHAETGSRTELALPAVRDTTEAVRKRAQQLCIGQKRPRDLQVEGQPDLNDSQSDDEEEEENSDVGEEGKEEDKEEKEEDKTDDDDDDDDIP